jgi:hypothetical protein
MSSKPIVAAILLAAAASSASAEQKAAKIAIAPGSEMGAIILKAPDLPKPIGGYISSYKIAFKKYDAANQSLDGGPYAGSLLLSARPSLFSQGYLVSDLKPGTYVVTEVSRQDLWALCFHDNSLQFTVKPGEVVYLGDFDAAFHMGELQQKAMAGHKMRLRQGNLAHFFDNVTPPRFTPGTEQDLPAVSEMMKSAMPKTSVAPQLAQFQPARFGTGRDLFGLSRICGGYYAGKAKPKES